MELLKGAFEVSVATEGGKQLRRRIIVSLGCGAKLRECTRSYMRGGTSLPSRCEPKAWQSRLPPIIVNEVNQIPVELGDCFVASFAFRSGLRLTLAMIQRTVRACSNSG